jgi:hypothetical protein
MPANTEAPTPIKLTLAQVKAAGLKAYEEKRLSAQGPTPACKYRDMSGLPCVVGAALSDDEAGRILAFKNEHGMPGSILGIEALSRLGIVQADCIGAIAGLQVIHDRWASAAEAQKTDRAAQAEAELLEMLRAA